MAKSLSDDEFIRELKNYDHKLVMDRGGYSRVFELLDGHLIVASSKDNGEPELDIYDLETCKEILSLAMEVYADFDCVCPFEYIRDLEDDAFPI